MRRRPSGLLLSLPPGSRLPPRCPPGPRESAAGPEGTFSETDRLPRVPARVRASLEGEAAPKLRVSAASEGRFRTRPWPGRRLRLVPWGPASDRVAVRVRFIPGRQSGDGAPARPPPERGQREGC